MGWFSSKVKVTFIDDATGQAFGVTQMPPSDLPETFEIATTLHLGDEDWSVVAAHPATRAEYAKSKTLSVRLRRIEKIDPRNLLYSLPTICDGIPPISEQPLSGGELILSEDDWRQVEFVSHELAAEADAELAAIRRIHETQRAEVGWREIHVRAKPEPPLARALTLAELAWALDAPAASPGVTYRGAPSPIAAGYAFPLAEGFSVYGVAPQGQVRVIAFARSRADALGPESVARLQRLAREVNLDLVDWCRCLRVTPDEPAFAALLSRDEV